MKMNLKANNMWKRYKDTFYEVSIDGRVRTIEHTVIRSNGVIHKCVKKELKPATDKKGYRRVGLSIDGKLVTKKVHRLVAECFISNFCDKPQVNHIDGNKANNYITNLEWVTNRENTIHAIRTGLTKRKKIEANS